MKTLFILLLCVSFCSCGEYYFSAPQPTDSKNITKIPKKLRGTWNIERSDKTGEKDSIIIGKSYYKKYSIAYIKESREMIEADTSALFIGNKIYTKGDDGLEGGYSYTVEGDSLEVRFSDMDLVDLGEGAFLRKIKYGYILNEHHDPLPGWWRIRFIDTRSDDGILVRGLKRNDLTLTKDYQSLNEELKQYIIASWSRREMEKFIRKGGFSDTLLVLKNEDMLKHN
jgi:hypothetical protein